MSLYGHLDSAMQVLSFSGARAADATIVATAWIPHSAPLGLPLAPLLGEALQPLVLGVLLAAGVGLSLPCGALVVLAGALFGFAVGLVTVVLAQAIGLTINWHLCRGVPRFALMVFAGDLGAAALRGSLSPVSLALRLVALAATGSALLLLARGLLLMPQRSGGEANPGLLLFAAPGEAHRFLPAAGPSCGAPAW
jgi:hypothetical protein